ncbi:MarR family winged helix-turn-helix transcriptional regulator [Microbacterium sp. Marseille-Q6965]|uniref:MarR family winged helix-turn-helix transcriptional regulator n=1 Tax=Microbacterium sp. Marseille-Q6965 TaxID=2965072 RepID=UPI0021B71973|nr:MarR family transcriptional regulator [Microbacterium sp. Marseille-Q6965]
MREKGDDAQSQLYDVRASDPDGVLVDRSQVPEEELPQIAALMTAVASLRAAEQRLTEASRRYMRLGDTDMRALHFLIVSGNRGAVVTPGALSQHLGITTAATTKLLDRLEAAEHITRTPHPTDRRALAIEITPRTREAAMQSVGRQQAQRFLAAARLTPAEREVVIRFLHDMAAMIDPGEDEAAPGRRFPAGTVQSSGPRSASKAAR